MIDGGDLVIPIKDQKLYYEAGYLALKAIINSVATSSQNEMLIGLRSALEDKEIIDNTENGIMQYLYAAGFLSFAGREITKESLAATLGAIGIQSDEKLLDIIMRSGISSHLVYIYAYYFLVANGKDPAGENIAKVVEAIGVSANSQRIREVLALI